ncbi:28S ribosomal protein S35, mitochondrial [Eupeodes corollae]|uniref:28S ribosomal protein S35, mitochondrial n=1 Tax=Eupeodes corollae TaxID=290404 RepID=UPI0024913952|nr:28S ribosomal protein S35, mitochondrial [Eupeodes corollae]
MSSLTRLIEHNLRLTGSKYSFYQARLLSSQATESSTNDAEEEFRVLNLRAVRNVAAKRKPYKKDPVPPPRTHKMATDQDWTAVWPGPRTFHPASVPLPIRQGFTEKGAPAPSKFGNAEIMKIPNFLHLTPRAIKQQCEALKRFCTPWPKGLETEEKCKKHFPVEVIYGDYVHGLPTIRNIEARRVTLKLKLSTLKFDQHAKDKFLRLIGNRYDPETDVITIMTDRCPLKKQNYDHAMYLLTACYHESFVTEPWEATKSEADMETYYFNRNKSKVSAEAILNWGKPEDAKKTTASEGFAKSVENLINEGENEYNIQKYKDEVKQMLGIVKS